jgi:hypothetical protein
MRIPLVLLTGLLFCLLVSPIATADKELGLEASLVDAEANASKASAVVRVEVVGADLVDPALATPDTKTIQAHLHYRVDEGPVIATPVAKLAFHELTAGRHRIEVVLAGPDHEPLGPSQILDVMIPARLVGVDR